MKISRRVQETDPKALEMANAHAEFVEESDRSKFVYKVVLTQARLKLLIDSLLVTMRTQITVVERMCQLLFRLDINLM